jgi:hypothetical protein
MPILLGSRSIRSGHSTKTSLCFALACLIAVANVSFITLADSLPASCRGMKPAGATTDEARHHFWDRGVIPDRDRLVYGAARLCGTGLSRRRVANRTLLYALSGYQSGVLVGATLKERTHV